MLTKWRKKHFSLSSLLLGCSPSPFPNPRDSLSRNRSWLSLFPRSSGSHLRHSRWHKMGCCGSTLSPSPAPASISQGSSQPSVGLPGSGDQLLNPIVPEQSFQPLRGVRCAAQEQLSAGHGCFYPWMPRAFWTESWLIYRCNITVYWQPGV